MPNYYQILGLNEGASSEEIKRVFRRLAMQYHPDRNRSSDAAQRFIEIQQAYDVLSDAEERSRYDQMLAGGFVELSLDDFIDSDGVPVDPITGNRNYKYHRGKPKKERDLNELFDNFDEKTTLPFEICYSSLGRVTLLGIPGLIVSFFIGISMYDGGAVNIGDVAIVVPFMLFHLFLIFDCFLDPNPYYALLIKVTDEVGSFWKELRLSITEQSTASLDYHSIKDKSWVKECLYVSKSSVDFARVQQFSIYASLIFKIKLRIYGIVDGIETDIRYNVYKANLLAALSFVQLVILGIVLWATIDYGFFYLALLAVQIVHILVFIVGGRVFSKNVRSELLDWLFPFHNF